MAAPIWNGIELDAMRELHFVLVVKPPSLLRPLGLSFQIPCLSLLTLLYARVIGKLVLFGICRLCAGRRSFPSSLQPCRGAVCRGVWPRRTRTVCRGGICGGGEGVYGEEEDQDGVLIMRDLASDTLSHYAVASRDQVEQGGCSSGRAERIRIRPRSRNTIRYDWPCTCQTQMWLMMRVWLDIKLLKHPDHRPIICPCLYSYHPIRLCDPPLN